MLYCKWNSSPNRSEWKYRLYIGYSKKVTNNPKNIVQAYEEKIEDIYYLNIRKGKYKKCNVCGEVKLTNKFNKNGKQGLMPMCKKCR